MSEQQTEDMLDELLATAEPTDIEQEIAAIRNTAENASQKINMLVALVKRTNDPAAIDALTEQCYHECEPETTEELLRTAIRLADSPINKVSPADQQRGTLAFFAAMAANDDEGRSVEEIERKWYDVRRYHEESPFTLDELGD